MYHWSKFHGYIEVEEGALEGLSDEDKKTITEGKGGIWFSTSDLVSTDRLVGVEKDTLVQFTLYKDEKGIGAENVRDGEGEPISGQTRPARRPRKKTGRGRGRGRG